MIGSLEASAEDKIAGYRFKLFGAADPPDATGTPRVEFGVVQGYTDRAGVPAPFATSFGGLYYRTNNEGPYQIPQHWVDLKSVAESGNAARFREHLRRRRRRLRQPGGESRRGTGGCHLRRQPGEHARHVSCTPTSRPAPCMWPCRASRKRWRRPIRLRRCWRSWVWLRTDRSY